jgi:hypothetical protein
MPRDITEKRRRKFKNVSSATCKSGVSSTGARQRKSNRSTGQVVFVLRIKKKNSQAGFTEETTVRTEAEF